MRWRQLLGLESDIEVVASADNGLPAAELAIDTRPDVCLLDLEIPQADGIEAATRILDTVNTRVTIVTRHARPGVLRRALATGIAGFVPKSTPAGELEDVIRDVAAGKRYTDHETAAAALRGSSNPHHRTRYRVRNHLDGLPPAGECPEGSGWLPFLSGQLQAQY